MKWLFHVIINAYLKKLRTVLKFYWLDGRWNKCVRVTISPNFWQHKLRWFLILYFIRKHENSACYTIPAWTMGSGYLFIGQEVIT